MSKMYVALDFPTWQETKRFLNNNQLDGIPVKVGMELFYREGLAVIENLQNRNHKIFLDLKLHDIPTTVKRAMANLAQLELDMVNVHALGGSEMIKQAKEGLSLSRHETKLIAVTLVTSLDDEAIQQDLKLSGTIEENVKHLAHVALESGADGVVCSVHEVEQIKRLCGNKFLTVTPGIRLDQTDTHDQKRIATPSIAKQAGSDYIVIGRSVTQADDPKAAYERALKEWEHGTI